MFFPSLSVYAIMCNEKDNLQDFVKQFDEATHIFLLDTGSDDGTFEQARELAKQSPDRITVERAIFDPFNFSKARNMCLDMVRNTMPEHTLCMWADLDERIESDWYTKLVSLFDDKNLRCDEPTVITTEMLFHVAPNGEVLMQYPQSKIHTVNGYKWQYACHEILEATGNSTKAVSDVTFTHNRDENKTRDYLPILEEQYIQNKSNLRSLYYYGRELYYSGQHDKALDVLKTANFAQVEVTPAQMVETYILAGEVAEILEQNPEPYWFTALSFNPQCSVAFLYLARHCYTTNDSAGQLYWARKGIEALDKSHINVIYNRKSEIAWQLYDYAGLAFDSMGKWQEALQTYALLLQEWIKTVPTNAQRRIQSNVEYLVGQVNLKSE